MYRVEFGRYDKYAPNARHRLDDGGSLVQSELSKGLALYEGWSLGRTYRAGL